MLCFCFREILVAHQRELQQRDKNKVIDTEKRQVDHGVTDG